MTRTFHIAAIFPVLLACNLALAASQDGAGTAARFDFPAGIAADLADNVYVADLNDCTIRKITPDGMVSTVAGTPEETGGADGHGPSARFFYPTGIAADGAGNLYVADTYNHTIRKITPAGIVTTIAGEAEMLGHADGKNSSARFNGPKGIALDKAGNLYVADTDNHAIRKITPQGVVTTLAGTMGTRGYADGQGAAARFNQPSGVATDGAGNVYVADTGNNTIRKITPSGVVTTLAGAGPSADAGHADGKGAGARFLSPEGVATDGAGNIYVADSGNHTIRKITPDGAVSTFAGKAESSGSEDGPAASARFHSPASLALDHTGNVYVADSENNTIRKITPQGVVTTLAGSAVQVEENEY